MTGAVAVHPRRKRHEDLGRGQAAQGKNSLNKTGSPPAARGGGLATAAPLLLLRQRGAATLQPSRALGSGPKGVAPTAFMALGSPSAESPRQLGLIRSRTATVVAALAGESSIKRAPVPQRPTSVQLGAVKSWQRGNKSVTRRKHANTAIKLRNLVGETRGNPCERRVHVFRGIRNGDMERVGLQDNMDFEGALDIVSLAKVVNRNATSVCGETAFGSMAHTGRKDPVGMANITVASPAGRDLARAPGVRQT